MPASPTPALPARHLAALARSAQPVFLVGLSHFARRVAANAILQKWIGADMDSAAPPVDLALLLPAAREDGSPGRSIGIDAVKSFVDRLCLTPYAGPLRAGFVEPASALTIESQNALLRYVEEPTVTSRILFSSRRSDDLIPTLLSRCRVVRLPGSAGDRGEAKWIMNLSGSEETEETVLKLYEILDDAEAVEKILEFRLARKAIDLFDAVSAGKRPSDKSVAAFMDRRIPAADGSALLVEIVLAAVCSNLRHPEPDRRLLDVARRLLVLQAELRYNPSRLLVFSAVQEWLDGLSEGYG
ncbi:MAG: hypothetical protein A3G34_09935 [Candidatus Lindowbacteria bacterium RIFCSPLOWO2_12_FULL_62_27]|nr:MAG: hypothetical protein A3G34_09935 [Candidatus Lindowbacteria bacterium RIFCSPLOWO2_12_FULL_62_27]OGH61561.1 MAG: hypothetical protein A3I06_02945 [Candidatus Lindowbacteria bacterium RIFCSPLOWO2_02_FULL_62_12]